ncbi:hypothetical protein PF008_g18515 [Phytophthora fragariae]|uniref:Secreted protein n=1 Tax=Phytophthora fragariae TaxID=53985 RepID=A0A6G0R5G1_9STRA|nr:hypothetical protein PF008_g18515 [Phytophthora fragariae]
MLHTMVYCSTVHVLLVHVFIHVFSNRVPTIIPHFACRELQRLNRYTFKLTNQRRNRKVHEIAC